MYNIIRISKKNRIFLPIHQLNMNFYILAVKNSYLIHILLKKIYFFFEVIFTIFYIFLHNFIKKYKSLLKNRDQK